MFYLMIAVVWIDRKSVFFSKLKGQGMQKRLVGLVTVIDSKFLLVAAFRIASVRQDCF